MREGVGIGRGMVSALHIESAGMEALKDSTEDIGEYEGRRRGGGRGFIGSYSITLLMSCPL